jgi:protein SCO1/2
MMSDAMDTLGVAGEKVQPIFISVDPDRDTPDVLADYVAAFHPRLVGLTGRPQELKAVAKAYGARYFKLYFPPSDDDQGDETADEDENLDYAVHHTAHTYLVGPDGRGLATFPHGTWPQDMAVRIHGLLDKQN